jgi:hypothetical protein
VLISAAVTVHLLMIKNRNSCRVYPP